MSDDAPNLHALCTKYAGPKTRGAPCNRCPIHGPCDLWHMKLPGMRNPDHEQAQRAMVKRLEVLAKEAVAR